MESVATLRSFHDRDQMAGAGPRLAGSDAEVSRQGRPAQRQAGSADLGGKGSGEGARPNRSESCRGSRAAVCTTRVDAVCGITARTGATQPKLQATILFAVPPSSPQPLQCPDAPMAEVIVILDGISPACTAARLMPRARKAPSNKTSIRRQDDMDLSMATNRPRNKRPREAVTLRRAGDERTGCELD